MRFCLVDQIIEMHPGESITAVKNLTSGEEYLADHFPGFPIMPGVLMVESLVQTGAWLMRHTENFAYSTILLKEARAVKFSHFVKPGQTLQTHCKVHKRDGNEYTLKASASRWTGSRRRPRGSRCISSICPISRPTWRTATARTSNMCENCSTRSGHPASTSCRFEPFPSINATRAYGVQRLHPAANKTRYESRVCI